MNPILSYYINLITSYGDEAYTMIRKVDNGLWEQAKEAIANNQPTRIFTFEPFESAM